MYRKLLTHFTTASVRETPQELFTNFIIIIIIVMCFSFAAAAVTAYHQLLNEWLVGISLREFCPVIRTLLCKNDNKFIIHCCHTMFSHLWEHANFVCGKDGCSFEASIQEEVKFFHFPQDETNGRQKSVFR
uniref:Uncharacterized protein n=1 Tax=Glossina pallidipes TaxID=7398 RepID=A0A1A9ZIS4_GLOPL